MARSVVVRACLSIIDIRTVMVPASIQCALDGKLALLTGVPIGWPSSRVADTNSPPFVPSRIGRMTTLILSPTFNVPGFQLPLNNCEGDPISTLHSVGACCPGTRSWIQQGGLVH